MLLVKYTPQSGGVQESYNAIIGKLHTTVVRYRASFPQLHNIGEFLDVVLPEAESDQDYFKRLEEMCSYLNELSVSSYVIRHLYHNFSADVEAVRNRTAPVNQEDSYIILP